MPIHDININSLFVDERCVSQLNKARQQDRGALRPLPK
jgi:hypothetical protein